MDKLAVDVAASPHFSVIEGYAETAVVGEMMKLLGLSRVDPKIMKITVGCRTRSPMF